MTFYMMKQAEIGHTFEIVAKRRLYCNGDCSRDQPRSLGAFDTRVSILPDCEQLNLRMDDIALVGNTTRSLCQRQR